MTRDGVAVYSRKSKFTGRGESVGNQIELCRRYIEEHYPQAAVLVYEDEGFSGGNTERPEFRRMMADAASGVFRTVVCYRLDRISRNIGDFAALIAKLESLGIDFVSIREQFDTSSPIGRAMMYISSVFSQLERETIAERIRDNMRELAKTGRWLGGVSPTGYTSEEREIESADGKIRKESHLKGIPGQTELVQAIYSVFLMTGSIVKTVEWLHERGCLTKNGRQFSRFTVRNILTNPVYTRADGDALRWLLKNGAGIYPDTDGFTGGKGISAYNRTLQKPGRTNKTKPIDEWIIAPGRHEGIIKGADWVEVQEKLRRNTHTSYRKPRGNTALLSGIIRCAACGEYMRPKAYANGGEEERQRFVYLCRTKERSRRELCRVKNAGGGEVDAAVLNAVIEIKTDEREFSRRLKSAEITGSAADPFFTVKDPPDLNKTAETVRDFKNLIKTLSLEQRRAVVRSLVREVTWDGGEARIYLALSDEGAVFPQCEDSK